MALLSQQDPPRDLTREWRPLSYFLKCHLGVKFRSGFRNWEINCELPTVDIWGSLK